MVYSFFRSGKVPAGCELDFDDCGSIDDAYSTDLAEDSSIHPEYDPEFSDDAREEILMETTLTEANKPKVCRRRRRVHADNLAAILATGDDSTGTATLPPHFRCAGHTLNLVATPTTDHVSRYMRLTHICNRLIMSRKL